MRSMCSEPRTLRRRHRLFVEMVRAKAEQQPGRAAQAAEGGTADGADDPQAERRAWERNRPADLPVYRSGEHSGDLSSV